MIGENIKLLPCNSGAVDQLELFGAAVDRHMCKWTLFECSKSAL